MWCRIQVTTTDISFELVVEPLITKEALRDRMNASNNFNCYYGNVLQSSDESTKNTNLLTYGL